MDWRAIACIVFICTAVNHLGLISAIESAIRRKLWIVDCPKCLTCWSVIAYGIATVPCGSPQGFIAAMPHLLAIALLCSYIALWLNLLMYAIDTLYNRIYGKIEYYTEENADEASAED